MSRQLIYKLCDFGICGTLKDSLSSTHLGSMRYLPVRSLDTFSPCSSHRISSLSARTSRRQRFLRHTLRHVGLGNESRTSSVSLSLSLSLSQHHLPSVGDQRRLTSSLVRTHHVLHVSNEERLATSTSVDTRSRHTRSHCHSVISDDQLHSPPTFSLSFSLVQTSSQR